MTINEQRQFILDRYRYASPKFRHMIATTDNTRQIIAIYCRIIGSDEKKAKKAKEVENEVVDSNPVEEYHQIDMFEYLASIRETGNTTDIQV